MVVTSKARGSRSVGAAWWLLQRHGAAGVWGWHGGYFTAKGQQLCGVCTVVPSKARGSRLELCLCV